MSKVRCLNDLIEHINHSIEDVNNMDIRTWDDATVVKNMYLAELLLLKAYTNNIKKINNIK